MIELAVFGTGRIGQVHAKNLAALPGVRLKYLVDPIANPARDDLALRTGASVVEAGAVFADRGVAGVVIASSTDTHADLLLEAVAAKKAIFCEKPISLDFRHRRQGFRRGRGLGPAGDAGLPAPL